MQYEIIWCNKCGKIIDDDEFVVNWGSCNECLDNHYSLYLEINPLQLDLFDDGSQVYIW